MFLTKSAIAGATGAVLGALQSSPVRAQTTPHEQDTTDVHGIADTSKLALKDEHAVNVKSFGAMGDGVTNDSSAIQAAIAAAGAGTVYFPKGTYIVNAGALVPTSGSAWIGGGIGVATIKLRDGQNGILINLAASSEVQLSNLTLDGNRTGAVSTSLVKLSGSSRIRLENLRLSNATHHCILYSGSNFDIFVRSCQMDGMGASGFMADLTEATSIERFAVEGCYVSTSAGSSSTGVGILVSHGADGSIAANIVDGVSGQFLNCISLRACQKVTVVGNQARRARDDGLTLYRGSKRVAIMGNEFTESQQTAGIFIYHEAGHVQREVIISGNVCAENAQAGIIIEGELEDSTIVSNTFSRNGRWGVYKTTTPCRNLVIVGNVFAFNGESGLSLAAGSHVLIVSNTFSNNGQNPDGLNDRSGIYLAVSDVVVAHNRAVDDQTAPTQQAGIRLRGVHRSIIEGNLIKGNRQEGIQISGGSSHNLVHSNRIEENGRQSNATYDAILCYDSNNNVIRDNLIRRGDAPNHHKYGIAVSGSPGAADGNTVEGNDVREAGRGGIYVNLKNVAGTVLRANRGYATESRGRAAASGTGTQVIFAIPHGLALAPSAVFVTPGSVDARNSFHVTSDATNITVTFATAPPTGVNNVILNWQAEV